MNYAANSSYNKEVAGILNCYETRLNEDELGKAIKTSSEKGLTVVSSNIISSRDRE